jgi:hypothetical protein
MSSTESPTQSLTLGAANVARLAQAERAIGEMSMAFELWPLAEPFAGGVLLPHGAVSLAHGLGHDVSLLDLLAQGPKPDPTRPDTNLRWASGLELAYQKISVLAGEQPITPSLVAQIFWYLDAPHLKREPPVEEPSPGPLPGSAVWTLAAKWVSQGVSPLWAAGLALATWEREGPDHGRKTPAGMVLVCGLAARLGLTPASLFALYPMMRLAAQDQDPHGLDGIIKEVRKEGSWRSFIGIFLAAAAQSARAQVKAIMSARQLHLEHSELIRTWTRAPNNPLKLLDLLFRRPVVDIPSIAVDLWVTQRTAGLIVKKLVEHGLLLEITGQKRGRKFAYLPLLDYFD